MEILEAINPVESYLCDMASMKWNPIATTLWTARCVMSGCR